MDKNHIIIDKEIGGIDLLPKENPEEEKIRVEKIDKAVDAYMTKVYGKGYNMKELLCTDED